MTEQRTNTGAEIAIVGMAGRFPGAPSVDALWRRLAAAEEGVRRFSPDELRAAGVDEATLADPAFVPAAGWVEGAERFDASFFHFTPREAELTDPQQRLFLECCWEALEDAGYAPGALPGPAGVYGGVGRGGYLQENLLPRRELLAGGGFFDLTVGNDKDYTATRVSYKLGLGGPSVAVQSACSTSLVAVHLACRALLGGECDLALAGGASIPSVEPRGYLFAEGGILSPDGRCRAFDADARGTIPGGGAGVVVLRRLEDALADGDEIRAVILGSALNNDGAGKMGFMAPGAEGQSSVIADALTIANVDPRSIGYVEAHGTGTPLGDPVEVDALTRAFRRWTADRGFCALGSLKTSIGHLDAAAGVAGLIKATLALRNRAIPATLHFRAPNPALRIETTPFFIAAETTEWSSAGPRRAGVSSFGIGGTNAHSVLEEAPPRAPRAGDPRPVELLVVSARTEAALDAMRERLAAHLEALPSAELADAAFTLQRGRVGMEWRAAVAAASGAEAARALRAAGGTFGGAARTVAFLFPGQGAQHVGMAAGVYASEPVFREALDRCAELLRPALGLDLREVLYPAAGSEAAAAERLAPTQVTQPALFAVEYALAKLWESWGVRPDAMLGHSVGELVAACLAGVFELEAALRLVAARGRLMQGCAPGAMLSVFLPEAELSARLPESLALAAVNGPATCVVSGPAEAVEAFAAGLEADGVEVRRLHTSHAFHSPMMEPAVAPFRELVARAAPRAPAAPYVSSLTGRWVTAAEATQPDYWARQLREPVRFAEGVRTLLETEGRVLLEVGPGRTLGTLVPRGGSHRAIASLPHPKNAEASAAALMDALGQAWCEGVAVDWAAFAAGRGGRRTPLPTYPFERQAYYLPRPAADVLRPGPAAAPEATRADMAEWFHLPSWRRSGVPAATAPRLDGELWLVLVDRCGVGAEVARRLEARGARVSSADAATVAAELGYDALVASLVRAGTPPAGVVHCGGIGGGTDVCAGVVALARALGRNGVTGPLRLVAATDGAQEVDGRDAVDPRKAAALGALRVIPQEYPDFACRAVDVGADDAPGDAARWIDAETAAADGAPAVAYRGGRRWVEAWEPLRLEAPRDAPMAERSVWMITGAMGPVGRVLASWLAREARARLVLVGRTPLPPRAGWDAPGADGEQGERIAWLRSLEAAGAEVRVAAADVADPEAMRGVVTEARAAWGRIDGVIHAASAPRTGCVAIADTGPAELDTYLRPKLGGVEVLDRLLADDPPAVAVAFGSIATILGGLHLAAYAAANAALAAFAHAGRLPWTVVDWDGWRTDGPATGFRMDAAEGVEALRRILALSRVPRIAASTGALQPRLERWIHGAEEPAPALPEAPAGGHARPSLRTAYVAPDGELEEAVAGVWSELLGVEGVGAADDFFELGGHSLLGTRVIARLRRMFGVEVPVDAIFRAPTVAALAAVVEDRLLEVVEAMGEYEALGLAAAEP